MASVAAKNYTGALIYFDKAINQDPNYINAYVHMGDVQRTQKDYNASLESYIEALQRDNKTKAAWSGMVEDYVVLNNYPKASESAAKIIEIKPNAKENWLKAGNLLQMQGLYDAAAEKYSSALNLDPKYKDALYRKGISLTAVSNNTGEEGAGGGHMQELEMMIVETEEEGVA